jgi:hypothetical protein
MGFWLVFISDNMGIPPKQVPYEYKQGEAFYKFRET